MNPEIFEKMLERISQGKYESDKLKILYKNAKNKNDIQSKKIQDHIIEYLQKNDILLYRKIVPESKINRKKFMERNGFTCANWNWSWSFVNHDKQIVAFGAWNTAYINDRQVTILSEKWNDVDKESLGYKQALQHIGVAEKKNYRYQVFNMIHGGHDQNGRSKIAGIDPNLRDVDVIEKDGNWIATIR